MPLKITNLRSKHKPRSVTEGMIQINVAYQLPAKREERAEAQEQLQNALAEFEEAMKETFERYDFMIKNV